jgi:endonuclease/exonuclease/phosphatase family metal-dependent hydrolase
MKILLWNVEWATLDMKRGVEIQRIYRDFSPDIACITEGYTQFWEKEGNLICAEEDYGYAIHNGRRKVMLISKNEWTDVDQIGSISLPSGRYCFGRTFGLNIHGVCIPWKSAHVTTGQKNRQVWQDHLQYLEGLKPIVENADSKTIVLGDFNQRIPRQYSRTDVYTKLLETFESNFSIATSGLIKEYDQQAIDHFAYTNDIKIKNIIGIDSHFGNMKLSDHFGFVIEI